MKLTKQVYYSDGEMIGIQYKYDRSCNVLNFTGYVWTDVKYGLGKTLIKQYDYIATDSDLIAHDDYISELKPYATIFVIAAGTPISASKGRLKKAIEKLKANNLKVKYFASSESFDKFITKKKGKTK